MMKSVLVVLAQIVVLVAVASTLALTVNHVRKRPLDYTKNQFASAPPHNIIGPSEHSGSSREKTAVREVNSMGETPLGVDAVKKAESATDKPPVGDHGFQELTTDQAIAHFNASAEWAVVFVDARNDEHYAEGHIPGAVQLDHYYADQFMPDVLPLAQAAEKIIVYCNGGDCEDSISVCEDLKSEGVAWDKLLLYKGGYKEWSQRMPVEAATESSE